MLTRLTMNHHLLEVCVDSLDGLRNALVSGADRIELCSSLAVGGMSPSLDVVSEAMDVMDSIVNKEDRILPLQIMVRLVGPSFVYSAAELDDMVRYIAEVRKLDEEKVAVHGGIAERSRQRFVSGFVFGCLTCDSAALYSCSKPTFISDSDRNSSLEAEGWAVDAKQAKKLKEACGPYSATFHRAFDDILHKDEALRQLWSLRFDRVLTSGGRGSVDRHLPVLHHLIAFASELSAIPSEDSNIQAFRSVMPPKECNLDAVESSQQTPSTSSALPLSSSQLPCHRILVMPGGGVRQHNANTLLSMGAMEIHSSVAFVSQ